VNLIRDCGEMNQRQRRAHKLYWTGLACYCVLLPVAVGLAKHFHAWRGRPLFMVLPLAAVVLILVSMMSYFSAADEMQRRILAEGCAYAFVVSVFATVALGFFEGDVIPVIPWSYRFVFMMVAWGISVQVAKARYK
jgi:CHASE2 domain-containing sensor protein